MNPIQLVTAVVLALVPALRGADLVDDPPTVIATDPQPGSVVADLTFVNVTFNEAVNGVDAADLLINGAPATNLLVVSPREYQFNFPQPPDGPVTVAWSANAGIADIDGTPNAFVPGASWTYTVDPNAIPTIAIISEFMADNENGLEDEDGTRSDWIEIYNPGTADVNLDGWFLTDTATNRTKWRFPAVTLGANRYLLVWASQKNRTNAAGQLHTNFRLSNNAGGYLALVNARGEVASEFVSYPAQRNDTSYGRDRVDPNIVGYFATATPGAQNFTTGVGFAPDPVFSLESGIYTNNSLTLTISAPAGTTIRYTLNGSEPISTSSLYSGPITFTTNMMIKARVFQTNLFPSRVEVRSFVMLDNTTRDFTSNLPILIISTHGVNVPEGIVPGGVRPRGNFVALDTFRGRSSLQGPIDVQGPAGFEIIGQTSAGFAKQPWRIEIQDELGNDRRVPLLGLPAEADWQLRNPYSDKCLMNDFLGYELWEGMGHYSCRRRFVEVFVDRGGGKLTYPGDYYGVLVLFERIEAGDNRVDIAELTRSHTNEPAITGGYIIKKDKDSAGDRGFSTAGGGGFSSQGIKYHEPKPTEITTAQENYIRNYVNRFEASMYAAGWTNATGTNHYSHYIDVDAFVDQQLHVEFTKQIDGYRLSGYYSKDRNGKLRPDPVWDWNLSFGNANYLNGGTTNGWYWAEISDADHIWLRRLVNGTSAVAGGNPNGPGDAEFRQKITDRWAVLRTNALNGERVTKRIDEVAAQLTEAAARNYAKYPILNTYIWPNPEGGSFHIDYTQPTYTAIISEMKKWMTGRFNWMDAQFVRSPVMSSSGGPITPGETVTIAAPAGTIYYTVDGSDPRLPRGGISPSARVYTGPITLSGNSRVVARAYQNPTSRWTPWSGPVAATFVVQTLRLVISEIMYHPAAPLAAPGVTNADEDFEYIELRNVSSNALNLKGVSISGGIDFIFPTDRNLAAGERVVVVKNRVAFTSRYGAASDAFVVGEYTGSLANDGNRLILEGPMREPILDFSYDDDWHPITDGFGFSLVAVNEDAAANAWGTAAQWRPGGTLNGTPGQGDTTVAIPQVIISEALTHTDPAPPYDTIELHNPTANDVNIGGWFLSDDFREPKKFRIPAGTIIPANGYRTFDETAFNAGTGGNIAFSLSSSGDEVYLFSADANGNLSGYIHGFEFGAQRNGVTFERYLTSRGEEHFVAAASATIGAANSAPRVGPIVVSEIMYRPPDVGANGGYWNNTEDEFIELHNITGSSVNLFDPARPTNAWQIAGTVDFAFPMNTTIPANSYLIVANFDPAAQPEQLAAFRARYSVPANIPIVGPYRNSLDNGNGTVTLYMPDTPEIDGTVPQVLVDRVEYSDRTPWPMAADGVGHALYRRNVLEYGNDPQNWAAGGPTPGAASSSGAGPAIATNPANQSAPAGGRAIFTAAAGGTGPFGYQWVFNGELIPGASSNVLVLNNVQATQEGEYQVIALNPFGATVSGSARLTVLVPANINLQPTSQVVLEKTNVNFTVIATTGNPPLRYQWLFNDAPITGATNSTLSLTSVEDPADAGNYVAAITDGNGTIYTAPASLTVLVTPSIIHPVPAAQIVAVQGETVTLGVQTRGTRPMGYQWRQKTTNGPTQLLATRVLNGNADFLTISNVQPTMDQAYYLLTLTNQAFRFQNVAHTNWFLTVLADSNANGLPDVWETAHFGSATGADPDGDSDGDTLSNRGEYIAGTNPKDNTSYLRVEEIASSGVANITFEAVSNRNYSVLFRDGLSAGPWNRLTDVVARSENSTVTVSDPSPGSNRFYRIVTPRQQ